MCLIISDDYDDEKDTCQTINILTGNTSPMM